MSNKIRLIILISRQLVRPTLNQLKQFHFRKTNTFVNNYFFINIGKMYIKFEQNYWNYFLNSNLKIKELNNKEYLELGINKFYTFLFYGMLLGLGFYQILKIFHNDTAKSENKFKKLNDINNRLDLLLDKLNKT